MAARRRQHAYHWILDEAGAYIVAAEQRIDRRELRWRHATALAAAASSMLTHRVETNEFFTRLAQDAAAAGGALSEWYGERTIHHMLDGVRPDGYGVLHLPGRAPAHLLLELDRDTEPVERLREKAARYARAIPRSMLRDMNLLILLAVPSAARAETASASCAGSPIQVAEWSAASHTSPLSVSLTCWSYRRP